jgi:tRNA pseudouridine55 synthase
LVGKDYTRLSDSYLKLNKTYEFSLKLGENSDTGDQEGEKIVISDAVPTKKAILEALEGFRGVIEQVPPKYSAIKIDGVRAYKRARRGEEVEIKPRKVTINKLELLKYSYPELRLRADVSSGTYIRTLGEDLGKKLATGAYCTQIVRTSIGQDLLKNAISLD